MNANEFLLELEKYRVVRGRDFYQAPNARALAPAAVEEDATPSDASAPTAERDFWENLKLVLDGHYPEAEAKRIYDHFRACHRGVVESLNLDDLEDIATLKA
mmetsp:Transcript_46685/g.145807  ORF Transcript_46685/g.145807 Transcript_46685/m.145807 type:complete len:102 (-) Transcript_46685:160-465(-)